MSNDSKYGRLYPERAVASIRNRVVNERDALLKGGNLAGASLWTDVLDLLESEGFPPDEPLFLLRGQDELAPAAVAFYFDHWLAAGLPMELGHKERFIEAMERWQPRKLPD